MPLPMGIVAAAVLLLLLPSSAAGGSYSQAVMPAAVTGWDQDNKSARELGLRAGTAHSKNAQTGGQAVLCMFVHWSELPHPMIVTGIA